jgi:hypothetical protein
VTPLGALGNIVRWDQPRQKLVWTIDDVLTPGKVTAIVAKPEVGKSPLASWMALNLAAGLDVFPDRWRVPEAEPVVYLDWETGVLAEERFTRMANSRGVDLVELGTDLTFIHCDQILSEQVYQQMIAGVRAHDARAVFIDTYSAALPGDIDFNSSAFSVHLRHLGQVSRETNACVVVLMHQKKEGEGLDAISGHGTAAGAIQTCIQLNRGANGSTEVKCIRHPRKKWPTFQVRWVDEPGPDGPTTFVGSDLEGVPWGLRPELVEGGAGAAAPDRASPNERRKAEATERTNAALADTWRLLTERTAMPRTDLLQMVEDGEQGQRAAKRALKRLIVAGAARINGGLVQVVPGFQGKTLDLVLAGAP